MLKGTVRKPEAADGEIDGFIVLHDPIGSDEVVDY
jgi:hypothetical protein